MIKPRTRAGAIGLALGVAALAGAGAALAASFGANQGQLGSASLSADCQSTTITPTWAIAYNASIPGYQVMSVELSGLETTCLNKNVKVVLADSSGVSQVVGSGTTPGSGSTASITLASPHSLTSTWPVQLIVIIYS